ncbi:uncharacterized protein [Physcomitrium patens]|uniref:uncharacterized protein isoform X2 n=1 Tax=Physcomitrium patens TaxID=3218 RepID=UPI003CCCB909
MLTNWCWNACQCLSFAHHSAKAQGPSACDPVVVFQRPSVERRLKHRVRGTIPWNQCKLETQIKPSVRTSIITKDLTIEAITRTLICSRAFSFCTHNTNSTEVPFSTKKYSFAEGPSCTMAKVAKEAKSSRFLSFPLTEGGFCFEMSVFTLTWTRCPGHTRECIPRRVALEIEKTKPTVHRLWTFCLDQNSTFVYCDLPAP